MIVGSWILVTVTALVALVLAALSTDAGRSRLAGRVLACCLLGHWLLLGADVLAALWLLMAVPLAWSGRGAGWQPTGTGRRLLGGVTAAVFAAALYLVVQRSDWLALPAEPARAQAAELAGRLLTNDLLLLLGLPLLALGLLAGNRRPVDSPRPGSARGEP